MNLLVWSADNNRYRRKCPKVDASIFDSALSHTRRSDASEKRKENSESTFGRFRLWTSFESSPVSVKVFRYKPTIDQHKLVSKSVSQTIITNNYIVRIYVLGIWRLKLYRLKYNNRELSPLWFLYDFQIMENLIKALIFIFPRSFSKILILIFFHCNYRGIHLVWFYVNCSWNINIGDLFSCWRTGNSRENSENSSDCFTNFIQYFSTYFLNRF